MDGKKAYPLKAAVEVLAKFPKAKFNETVDLAFRLGVDPKQSDQMVRGTVPLPHGSGKTVRVLVFAKSGPAAEAAKAAGAEYVGFEDMIKKCQEGWTDFDVAVATPEAMGEVRKLGKVLGPRGLMPNPEDRHRDRRHRQGGQRSQSRPRRVQDRQGGQHSRAGGQGRVHARRRSKKTPAPSSMPIAKARPHSVEGHLYSKLHAFGDHESAGAGGPEGIRGLSASLP